MMKPDRLQVFLTPSWLIPKLGERSWNEKLASSGVGTLRFTTQFCKVTELKGSKRCERAALLQPHLWPISWVMVIPRSKPVSSVITQLHSLLQAPPSRATPLTWLFPSGNTRSYLWEQGPQTLGWTSFPGRFPSHAPLWTYEERADITPCDVQEKISMQGVWIIRGVYLPAPLAHTGEGRRDIGRQLDLRLKFQKDSFTTSSLSASIQMARLATFLSHRFIWRHTFSSYLWLWQDDHADQVHPHVAAQANVSQQLWGLCAEDQHKDFNGNKIRTICDEKKDLERAGTWRFQHTVWYCW